MEAQTKSTAQQSLDKIIQSLTAVDTAYASGNTAEAQSDFDTANNEWKSVSSKISARESPRGAAPLRLNSDKAKEQGRPKGDQQSRAWHCRGATGRYRARTT